MIYHSIWPLKEVVHLKPSIKKDLTQLQIDYITRLYDRIPVIDKEIAVRFLSSEIRLLWYKEMLALFNEFNKIERLTREFVDFDENVLNMIALVDFIRNLLLHFPYFATWNDVFVSREIARSQQFPIKNGKITKFLESSKDRKSFFLRMKYFGNAGQREAKVLFPVVESDDQEIFLKDIINESNGAICVLAVMNSICNKLMKPHSISKLNSSLNETSKRLDMFIKAHILSNKLHLHRLGFEEPERWYSNIPL